MEEEKNLIPLVLYFSKEGINLIIVVSFATGLCTLLGRVPAGERKREAAADLRKQQIVFDHQLTKNFLIVSCLIYLCPFLEDTVDKRLRYGGQETPWETKVHRPRHQQGGGSECW